MGWEGRKGRKKGGRKERKKKKGRKKKQVTTKQGKKEGWEEERNAGGREGEGEEGRRKKVTMQMSIESVTPNTFIISRSFNTSDNMKYYYTLFRVMDMKLKVDK